MPSSPGGTFGPSSPHMCSAVAWRSCSWYSCCVRLGWQNAQRPCRLPLVTRYRHRRILCCIQRCLQHRRRARALQLIIAVSVVPFSAAGRASGFPKAITPQAVVGDDGSCCFLMSAALVFLTLPSFQCHVPFWRSPDSEMNTETTGREKQWTEDTTTTEHSHTHRHPHPHPSTPKPTPTHLTLLSNFIFFFIFFLI